MVRVRSSSVHLHPYNTKCQRDKKEIKTYELLVLLELEAVKVSVGGTLGTGSDLLGPGGLGPGASKVLLLDGSLENSLAGTTGNLDNEGSQGQAAESVAGTGNTGGGALNESLRFSNRKDKEKGPG
jgi:hypothetical protein